jgi:hypothetical protein
VVNPPAPESGREEQARGRDAFCAVALARAACVVALALAGCVGAPRDSVTAPVAAGAAAWSTHGPDAPGAGADALPCGPTLLIVHAPQLEAVAARWARYRRAGGWNVLLHEAARGDDPDRAREGILGAIRSVAARIDGGPGSLSVLLLGDAGPGGIPAWTFPQHDPQLRALSDPLYATDHPYQTPFGGHEPQVALGRVPARDALQAETFLTRLMLHESPAELGPWRRRVVYAAGEGRYGAADAVLESLFRTMVDRLVPEAFDVSMTYAKATSVYCPPPSTLSDTLLTRLGEGFMLFNYVGHGSARELDYLLWRRRAVPILSADDLERLGNSSGRGTVALLTCCSAGWYDLPGGAPSLAEALLFHPAGPAGVIAGSRPTHPYANMVLQKELTSHLLGGRARTLGELDLCTTRDMLRTDATDAQLDAVVLPVALLARWPSDLGALRQMHVQLYNLLGDPATRIDLPAHIAGLRIEAGRLTGRIERMHGGRATVTFETARADPARSAGLLPVDGADDPDLERKAAVNYALANDPVLLRVEAKVASGALDVALPETMPEGTAVVKVYALGTDEEGRALDAMGALRLPPPAPPEYPQP